MAKTKPIGVRFDETLLNDLKNAGLADSPQKALNLFERSYLELINLKIEINNQPENKKRITEERMSQTKKEVFENLVHFGQAVVHEPTGIVGVTLSEAERGVLEERLRVIDAEMKNPPKNPIIGLRMWYAAREKEKKEILSKLQNK